MSILLKEKGEEKGRHIHELTILLQALGEF